MDNDKNTREQDQPNDDFQFLGAQTDDKKQIKKSGALKRFMPVIILCATAVLLFTAAFALRHFIPEEQEDPYDTKDKVKIFDFNGTGAERLEIKNDIDEYAFVRKLEKTYYIDGKEKLPVNNERILEALEYVGELSAQSVVAENVTDFEQYGLAEPLSTVTWKKGEKTYSFEIGSKSPSGAYYIKLPGESKVYTYNATAAEYFLSPRMDYYDTALYDFDINENAPYVNTFSIGQKGGDTITAVYRDVAEDELMSSYQMTTPIVHDFSTTQAANVMYLISNLSSCTVYDDDLSKENLAKYGLDDPNYTFSFTDVSEKHTLYFGNVSDEDYIYMYSDKNDFVYIVDIKNITVLALSIADYCEIMSYNRSYDTVDKITIVGGGKTFNLQITGTADDDNLKGYINNKYVEYENFADLYSHLISLEIKGVGTRKPDSKLLVTVTFQMLDGSVDVLKYYEKDELESYYELNGEGRLLVSTSNVEQILEYAQKLYDGEEIILGW